jgi:hypothetical protein
LLDDNIEAARKAGDELVNGTISAETMRTISDVPITKNDYREITNASFKGGLTGKAKTIALGIRAMRNKGKKKPV